MGNLERDRAPHRKRSAHLWNVNGDQDRKSWSLDTRPPMAPTLPLKSRSFSTPRWQFFDKT
jgi:hypothetical protein